MNSTIRDVAEKAGVSVATVSRTFAKPDLVMPDTRNRVLAAADELNFVISRSATALKSRHTMRVAMLSSDTSDWFDAHIYKGLNQVFQSTGYDLAVYAINNVDQRQAFFKELPLRRNTDAIVVSSFNVAAQEFDDLQSINVPILGINVPHNNKFDATLSVNDRDDMQLIVNHLHALGHVRIAYAGTDLEEAPLEYSADYRRKWFEIACKTYPDIIPSIISVPRESAVADETISRLIMMREQPTAICCLSDATAIPLLFKLPKTGLSVPSDISLVGFDDSPYSEELGLTTIHQDPYSMGLRAARITLELIARNKTGETKTATQPKGIFETAPSFLAIRNTTAAPRS